MKRRASALILLLLLPVIAFAQAVNINTASKDQLMSLKGIGAVKAQAIIDYREQAPFRRIEDIMRVKGIGPATFAGFKDSITVGEVPPLVESPKPSRIQEASPLELGTHVAAPAASVGTAVFSAPQSAAAPFWLYLVGLAALTGFGIAAATYVRLFVLKQEETNSLAREFEIEG